MSRRSVLAGGALVGVSAAAGVTVAAGGADEVLGALGVDPQPLPDAGDQRLARAARADLDALVALAVAEGAPEPVLVALRAQVEALPTASRPAAALTGAVDEACRAQADARADDVARAVSPSLAVVLASLAAGLDQCADAAGAS